MLGPPVVYLGRQREPRADGLQSAREVVEMQLEISPGAWPEAEVLAELRDRVRAVDAECAAAAP